MECEKYNTEKYDEIPIATEALYDDIMMVIFFIEILYIGECMQCLIEPIMECLGTLLEFDANEIIEGGGGAEEEIPGHA
jgi:hypothetical protein